MLRAPHTCPPAAGGGPESPGLRQPSGRPLQSQAGAWTESHAIQGSLLSGDAWAKGPRATSRSELHAGCAPAAHLAPGLGPQACHVPGGWGPQALKKHADPACLESPPGPPCSPAPSISTTVQCLSTNEWSSQDPFNGDTEAAALAWAAHVHTAAHSSPVHPSEVPGTIQKVGSSSFTDEETEAQRGLPQVLRH